MPLCEVCPINNQLHSELVCSYCSREICRVCTRNGSVCFLCHERGLDDDEEVQSDDIEETAELMNLYKSPPKQNPCIICGTGNVTPPVLCCEVCCLKPLFPTAAERDAEIANYNLKNRPSIRFCPCGAYVWMSHVIICKGCNTKYGCMRCMKQPCETCKLNKPSCFLCSNKENLTTCTCAKSTCMTCKELGIGCCALAKPQPAQPNPPQITEPPPDNMEPLDLATLRHNAVMAAIAALSEKIDKYVSVERTPFMSDLHRNYLMRQKLGIPY
jgi:hypothetical protein